MCAVWKVDTLRVSTEPMFHYDDVIMGAMASQITSIAIVYSTVYSDADQRKHQSSAWLAFVRFPAQVASNAENVSIWWRHHVTKWHQKIQHRLSVTENFAHIKNGIPYFLSDLFEKEHWLNLNCVTFISLLLQNVTQISQSAAQVIITCILPRGPFQRMSS